FPALAKARRSARIGRHAGWYSHTRTAQSLYFPAAACRGRVWASTQAQGPTRARDRCARRSVARRSGRRDLWAAWTKRRREVDDCRHPHDTCATDKWPSVDRRLRRVGAAGRRETTHRRCWATTKSRLHAYRPRDFALSRRLLRYRL